MNLEEKLNEMAWQKYPASFVGGIDILAGRREGYMECARALMPEVKGLVELFQRSLEIRNFEAPEDAEVKALGERIGFGALLDSAVKGWHQSAKEKGYPSGGAFTVGHCHATVESALTAFNEFCKKEGE